MHTDQVQRFTVMVVDFCIDGWYVVLNHIFYTGVAEFEFGIKVHPVIIINGHLYSVRIVLFKTIELTFPFLSDSIVRKISGFSSVIMEQNFSYCVLS